LHRFAAKSNGDNSGGRYSNDQQDLGEHPGQDVTVDLRPGGLDDRRYQDDAVDQGDRAPAAIASR